jgi:hypothetical protein
MEKSATFSRELAVASWSHVRPIVDREDTNHVSSILDRIERTLHDKLEASAACATDDTLEETSAASPTSHNPSEDVHDDESPRDYTPGAVAVYEECYHEERYYEGHSVPLHKGSLTVPGDAPPIPVDSENIPNVQVPDVEVQDVEVARQAPPLEPEVAEPSNVEGADNQKFKGRTMYLRLAVFCLVIIAIAVAVPLALRKGDDPTTMSAPENPSPATLAPINLESFEEFRTVLGLWGDQALSDPTSDQYQALKWLSTEDPAMLSPNDTSRKILIERYTVALLYFSTNGPGWKSQHGFLLQDPVCSWNIDETFGIQCQDDENDSVSHIYLGKYNINII